MITISWNRGYRHIEYSPLVNNRVAKLPRFTSHQANLSHNMICNQVKETVMIHLLSIINDIEPSRNRLCQCYKVQT